MPTQSNQVADDAYEEDAQKWARLVAPKLNATQRRSLAAQFRRIAREAIKRASAASKPHDVRPATIEGLTLDEVDHTLLRESWRCSCKRESQHDTVVTWDPMCELHGEAMP